MFIDELGRWCEIVNLDFANDILPYKAALDVRDLISLQVMGTAEYCDCMVLRRPLLPSTITISTTTHFPSICALNFDQLLFFIIIY